MERKPRKPFVLIVEDDLDIAAYFQSVMDMAGYRTDVAVNGHQALEILFTTPPDIILLDITMPEIDGGDVVSQLRADPALKNAPVLFLTATVSKSEVSSHNGRIGGEFFLAKPVSAEVLIRSIEEHLVPIESGKA